MSTPDLPPPDTALPLIVLDTNAVLDGWLFNDACMADVRAELARGGIKWVATQSMRDELVHTLNRPHLLTWQAEEGQVMKPFDMWAQICAAPASPADPCLWCTDNDDQKFIDLAVALKAHWLLSKDRAVLKLAGKASRRGVTIIEPSRWRSTLASRGLNL